MSIPSGNSSKHPLKAPHRPAPREESLSTERLHQRRAVKNWVGYAMRKWGNWWRDKKITPAPGPDIPRGRRRPPTPPNYQTWGETTLFVLRGGGEGDDDPASVDPCVRGPGDVRKLHLYWHLGLLGIWRGDKVGVFYTLLSERAEMKVALWGDPGWNGIGIGILRGFYGGATWIILLVRIGFFKTDFDGISRKKFLRLTFVIGLQIGSRMWKLRLYV